MRFLQGDPGRRLVILGHFDPTRLPSALRGQVERHPFTDYAGYLGHLASCDAAVMPLADDLFNRCKSAVRVIDAASVGVPSLVGQVSDMGAMVRDGETGHVLGPEARWAETLEAMAAAPETTARMGQRARRPGNPLGRRAGHAGDRPGDDPLGDGMSAPHLLVGNIFFAPYTYGGATIVAEEVARHLALDHGWQVSAVSAVSRADLPAYALRKVQTGPVPNYLINLPPGAATRRITTIRR